MRRAPIRFRGSRCGCRRTASPDRGPLRARGGRSRARDGRNPAASGPGGGGLPVGDHGITGRHPGEQGRGRPAHRDQPRSPAGCWDRVRRGFDPREPSSSRKSSWSPFRPASIGRRGKAAAPGSSRVAEYRAEQDDDVLAGGETAVFKVKVKATSAGAFMWTARAWSSRSCDGGSFVSVPLAIVVGPNPTPRRTDTNADTGQRRPSRRRRRPRTPLPHHRQCRHRRHGLAQPRPRHRGPPRRRRRHPRRGRSRRRGRRRLHRRRPMLRRHRLPHRVPKRRLRRRRSPAPSRRPEILPRQVQPQAAIRADGGPTSAAPDGSYRGSGGPTSTSRSPAWEKASGSLGSAAARPTCSLLPGLLLVARRARAGGRGRALAAGDPPADRLVRRRQAPSRLGPAGATTKTADAGRPLRHPPLRPILGKRLG